MEKILEYKTIQSSVTDILIKIKGSKFYGAISPIQNEEEIKKFIKEIQIIYPKATHYCYAYRLGFTGNIFRTHDDGEPSGTAGLPIYNQLLSVEITNVILIITRYFGGTKLGVSGLIKAYKEVAQETIQNSTIISCELYEVYQLQFDYSYQSNVMSLLKKLSILIQSTNFNQDCTLIIKIPLKKKNIFLNEFNYLLNKELIKLNKVI